MKDTYPRPFFDGPLRPEPVEGLHPPNIQTIQVTRDICIRFDISDHWFGLHDIEAGPSTGLRKFVYDELGAVLMTFDDLDALIVALGQLRERVK